MLARSENPFMLGCLLNRKSIPKQTFEEQDDSPTKKTSERTKADVVSAGPWMLCENGWSLGGRFSWLAHGCCAENGWALGGRYHGWPMDALRERSLGGQYHGGPTDALRERMESGWALSCLAKTEEGACDCEAAGDVCPVKRSTGGTCLSPS